MNQVLVVDDEAPMREALEAHFCRDGWEVTTAYGANDALAKFRRDAVSAGGDGHAHAGRRRPAASCAGCGSWLRRWA